MGTELKASGTSDPNKETVKAKWLQAVHEIFVDVFGRDTEGCRVWRIFMKTQVWDMIKNN